MHIFLRKLLRNRYNKKAQLEFEFERPLEGDRNIEHGGRSFYFFDFDDNIAFLPTPIAIYHKDTNHEILLSSGEFAKESKFIGKCGIYQKYYLNFDDSVGSFRFFRDKNLNLLDKITGKKQSFINDLLSALEKPDNHWKAPSWNCFYHAIYNKRPMSIITARGHEIETIKSGIQVLVDYGHVPHLPNLLSVFPVSNPKIREALSEGKQHTVPELKKKAIRLSVEEAIKKYGHNPYHRFGMSDDDPSNIELITEEMRLLKRDYKEMSFFVIYTGPQGDIKREIFEHRTEESDVDVAELMSNQLDFFSTTF